MHCVAHYRGGWCVKYCILHAHVRGRARAKSERGEGEREREEDVDTSVLTFSFLLSVRFSSMQCAMPVKEGDGRCAKASSPILKVEDVRWCGYFDFLPPYLVHGRFVQAPFRWCPITHDSSKIVSLPLKSAATS